MAIDTVRPLLPIPAPEAPRSGALDHNPTPVSSDAPASTFSRLVRGLGSAIESSEGRMRSALSTPTGSLDPAQLIALQAGVYRYSEVVDLASRLVDHATTAVKTVLQSQ